MYSLYHHSHGFYTYLLLYIFETKVSIFTKENNYFLSTKPFSRSSTMASSGLRENVHLNAKLE